MEPFLTYIRGLTYNLLRKARVDRAVFLGLLARIWGILAGVVTLLVIAYNFSPQLQGYYYTFFSIISFQFLIELGAGNIIIQFASHEWAKLSLDKRGRIVGDKESLSRLQSLARIFLRWYCVASIILTLGLAICGFLIFSKNHDPNISWVLPWFCLCLCNGAVFCLIPIWSLLEGCNQLLKLYSYRLVQAVFLNVSLWIAVLLGAKLWAIVISNVVILICAAGFLLYKCRLFINALLFSPLEGGSIKWSQEILPLQWRTTISWLIGPLALNLFVPVLFRYHGSVVAGQMGMTLYLASAALTLSSSWLSPKIPQFGMLIAKKNYKDLDRLFWRTAEIFTIIAVLVAIAAWILIYLLNAFKFNLASRFLPVFPAGLFILAQVILGLTVPFATYLRIHKKEPLLWVSIGSGVSVGLSTLILGKYYSAVGMGMGFLLINLITVPAVMIIWYRCRRQWHDRNNIDVETANNVLINEVLN